MRPRPPRLAERIIAHRVGGPDRHYLLGDLEERFGDVARERSPLRARLWYWRQTLLIAVSPALSGEGGRRAGAGFGGDLRFAWRTMRGRPLQSVIAVAALAVGIGLAGSAFSILDGTVLRGLPFEEADRLVHFERADVERGVASLAVTPHDWWEWRGVQRSFEDLGAYVEAAALLPGDNAPPTRHWGVFISAASFDLLRVRASLGRTFTDDDERIGAPPVVLLSHGLWVRQFGADRGLVGRDIVLNGRPVTVVGVMPEGFGFPIAEEFWLPLRIDPASTLRGEGRLDAFGRLRDGVALETAKLEFETIGRRLADAHPATNAGIEPVLRGFLDEYVGDDFTRTVWSMLAASALVLMICCANVANLLLGHAWRRRHDLAIRTALGASRMRLIRSLLLESSMLSAAGAALGILIAWLGVRWFNLAGAQAGAFALPHGSDTLFWWDVRLDATTLLFVTGITILAALLAGLAPAVQAARSGPGDALHSEARGGSASRLFSRFTRGLVVVELALATGLLVAGGFVAESVVNIARESQQLDGRDVHVATVSLPLGALGLSEAAYPDAQSHVRMAARLVDSFAAEASVSAAAFGTSLPFARPRSVPFTPDVAEPRVDEDLPATSLTVVSPGWFEVFGVGIAAGRDFAEGDAAGSSPVAIVNRSFAAIHLPDREPLGARIRLGGSSSSETWLTVVGVVPDLWTDRERPLRQAGVYVPLAQSTIGDADIRLGRLGLRTQNVAVRERSTTPGLDVRLRGRVYGLDPDLPVTIRPFDEIVGRQRGRYHVWGRFYFAFAASGLLLAALGVYGVLSFSVTSRTAEIGIRRAIGATAGAVHLAIMRDALAQVATGVAAGLLLGVWIASGIGRVVYEVDTADPRVFIAVVAVLGSAGAVAGWLPARRAARIDPAIAMRTK